MTLHKQTEHTARTVSALNELLANLHVHYQKLRSYHWNVQGKQFFELHNKFETMYDEVKQRIDEVAERILTLGSHPVSTLAEYLEYSSIDETGFKINDTEMVSNLTRDIKILVEKMNIVLDSCEKDNDSGTEDLIAGYVAAAEKDHWMLSAFLSKELEPAHINMN